MWRPPGSRCGGRASLGTRATNLAPIGRAKLLANTSRLPSNCLLRAAMLQIFVGVFAKHHLLGPEELSGRGFPDAVAVPVFFFIGGYFPLARLGLGQ